MAFDGSRLQAVVPQVFLPRPGTPFWLMMRRDRCHVFPAAPRGGMAA
jgi:iron(III) transport system ATP-binding protein